MALKVSNIEKEFILRNASGESVPFRFHGTRKETHCGLVEFAKDYLVFQALDAEWKHFANWDKVSVYFTFRGQTLTFATKIRKIEEGRLVVVNPESLLRGPARRFVRVPPPQGLRLTFFLQEEEFALDFPMSHEYVPVQEPGMNADFDLESLHSLIEDFKSKAARLANDYRIVMFKNRKPESFEEKLIARLGKILYIPSTKSGLPHADPYPSGRIITRYFEEHKEGKETDEVDAVVEKLVAEKKKNLIHTELWCPILYYQYVTGYVYMANSGENTACFNLDAVDFAYDFSRILAYFFKMHDYFNDTSLKAERKPYEAQIVDVSASGVLLSVPTSELSLLLGKRPLIDVSLGFQNMEIRTQARIARKYAEGAGTFFGIDFQGMSDSELGALHHFLYKKPYAANGVEGNA